MGEYWAAGQVKVPGLPITGHLQLQELCYTEGQGGQVPSAFTLGLKQQLLVRGVSRGVWLVGVWGVKVLSGAIGRC